MPVPSHLCTYAVRADVPVATMTALQNSTTTMQGWLWRQLDWERGFLAGLPFRGPGGTCLLSHGAVALKGSGPEATQGFPVPQGCAWHCMVAQD